MLSDIGRNRDALAALCRRFAVLRLEVFGSAARGKDFDPKSSDIDFLVVFDPHSDLPPLQRHFGLAQALEDLFGRRVDLVEESAVTNPYVRAGINRSREPVYGS